MCSHYQILKELDKLKRHFHIDFQIAEAWREDVWPQYLAPFIRRADTVEFRKEQALGQFGLMPHWAKESTFGRRTYNVRAETAAEKPAFRDSWRRGRKCIIPASAFYEPSWETGKAIPWKIFGIDGEPFGIAGLWSSWRSPGGEEVLSFSMLTINADGHPLMQRFHRPEDEKRMVVILHPDDFDRWLAGPMEEAVSFLQRYPADRMQAVPEPPKPRARKAPPPEDEGLF